MPITLTKTTVSLIKMKYTLIYNGIAMQAGKQPEKTATSQSRETSRVINARTAYAQFFLNIGANDHVVYLDESGYNVYTRRQQGRAPVGERVCREVVPRGRNMVATLAISSEFGLLHN